jgi:hypothetical protein
LYPEYVKKKEDFYNSKIKRQPYLKWAKYLSRLSSRKDTQVDNRPICA